MRGFLKYGWSSYICVRYHLTLCQDSSKVARCWQKLSNFAKSFRCCQKLAKVGKFASWRDDKILRSLQLGRFSWWTIWPQAQLEPRTLFCLLNIVSSFVLLLSGIAVCSAATATTSKYVFDAGRWVSQNVAAASGCNYSTYFLVQLFLLVLLFLVQLFLPIS